MDILFFLFFVGLACGFIGAWIAEKKERSKFEGFFLGFFLSALGLIIEGLLPSEQKPIAHSGNKRPLRKCPFCAEMVLSEAAVCRYCQRDLPGIEKQSNDEIFHSLAK